MDEDQGSSIKSMKKHVYKYLEVVIGVGALVLTCRLMFCVQWNVNESV